MARFHSLSVTDVKKTIRDAVVVTFKADDPDAFAFTQGQYMTFRRHFDGEELRRSYSICSGLDDGNLQVGIKKVDGGAFSTWANETLKVGDRIDAMVPMGTFHTPLDGTKEKQYLGFAGGSGITPVLSILRTVLTREPDARFTLVYANKAVSSIMFRDELEDLKNQFNTRLNIIHILKQDAQDIDLFTGRVDAAKCALLFKHWIPIDSVTTAYICGPQPMMLEIVEALKSHGLTDAQIKYELFGSSQPGRAKQKARSAGADENQNATQAHVTLGGESRSFKMPKDMTLLEAVIDNNIDAPFACKAGVCSTCRAKVTEGEVEMVQNHALEDGEVARGYVLTCQCYPLTDKVVFTYDDH